MGTNQHLVRSVLAIRAQGGVKLANGDRVMPDPILIGRNADKTAGLARQYGVERWSTSLDKALANKDDELFFDAATTQMRPKLLEKAIRAGKHIYCEKPIATTFDEALNACRLAEKAGVKNSMVADKIFLPGLMKLKFLRDSGFFRTHAGGPWRVWLLGLRRRLAANPAAIVELQARRRWRDHS